MNHNWKVIRHFYSQNGIFTCSKRGMGTESCNIQVINKVFRPATDRLIRKYEEIMKKKFPPSMKQFFKCTNGGVFLAQYLPTGNIWARMALRLIYSFTRCGQKYLFNYATGFQFGHVDRLNENQKEYLEGLINYRVMDCSSGFRLYSLDELPLGNYEVLSWLREIVDDEDSCLPDSPDDPDKHKHLNWLDNILIIGEELNSGNYLAIDYNRQSNNGEYPIIFMDHEIPFSYIEPDDNQPVVARSIYDLLVHAMDDSAVFLMKVLGGTACYTDGDPKIQWFPESYRPTSEKIKILSIREKTTCSLKPSDFRHGQSLHNVDHITSSQLENNQLLQLSPNNVLDEDMIYFYKITAKTDPSSSVSKIPDIDTCISIFCDALTRDLLNDTDLPDNDPTIVTINQLKDTLLSKPIDFIKVFVIINYIIDSARKKMPTGCNSWPILVSLGPRLYESILNVHKDKPNLDKRALAIYKELFPSDKK